jgi:hypothetical protein
MTPLTGLRLQSCGMLATRARSDKISLRQVFLIKVPDFYLRLSVSASSAVEEFLLALA